MSLFVEATAKPMTSLAGNIVLDAMVLVWQMM
jgi:hypothetical protein